MDTLFGAFLVTSFLLIIIPGPNVLVIVSTSMSEGRKRGLQVVAGTSTAMLIQLFIAAVATSWFVAALAEGFAWLRFIGIACLFYFAMRHFASMRSGNSNQAGEGTSTTFFRGFIVSLANPKTLLFFSAYLPQFVSQQGSYLAQISILSACFLLIAVIFDSLYALLAGALMPYFRQPCAHMVRHGVSGSLYLCAGMWLLWQRRIE